MQRSLSIDSIRTGVYAGKKNTKTLGYVNPDATAAQMQSTVQKYNALSTKIYEDATVVEKYPVDEQTTAKKIVPQITLGSWRPTTGAGKVADITCTSDATTILSSTPEAHVAESQGTLQAWTTAAGVSGVFYVNETDKYSPAVIPFTAN